MIAISWDFINSKYKLYKQLYKDIKTLDFISSKRLLLVDSLITYLENIVLSYEFPVKSYKDIIHLKEEREFLFFRVLEGKTIDDTAYAMSISRDTAYRINRRLRNRNIELEPIINSLLEKEREVLDSLNDDSSQLENSIVVILTNNDVNIDNIKNDLIKIGYKIY